jgi:YebC/PmpR family DNA-binding regulatory protein
MGAQWKQAGRVAAAQKKGLMVGKIAKEIAVAAKLGGPDPLGNARLRAALEDARKNSVTRDTIDRAIKKGAGLTGETITYELVTYEGFTPHKVPVIVECLTDNKNRTASEIRSLFRKGQLGAQGAVGWMFDRLGMVEASIEKTGIDIEEAAIIANAQNVEPIEESEAEQGKTGARFFTEPTMLDQVSKGLTELGWVISKSELMYQAKNLVDVTPEQRKEIEEFLGAIDDFDDVHRVYAAIG